MKRNFWLSDEQFALIEPDLPYRAAGKCRKDDRRVISEIIHVLQTGCRWQDCPPENGLHTTVYNRYNCWSQKGIRESRRDKIWSEITDRSKNKAAVAVLMLVAPRPSELLKGVTVMVEGASIQIGIKGAKIVEGWSGQKTRDIQIHADTPEAQYLIRQVQSHGGTLLVKATSVSGLNKLLVRTEQRVLGKKITLSAYVK